MQRPIAIVTPDFDKLDPAPLPADWVIEGTPHATATSISKSTDRTCAVVAWSCTPGRFHWYYSVDETLYITAGAVDVTDENGKVRHLKAGDLAYFPAGSHSIWHVTETITKVAFCRHHIPFLFGFALRAWKRFMKILYGDEPAGELAAPMPEAAPAPARGEGARAGAV